MSWEGFAYAPIAAIQQRLAARRARTERKNFLRFLRQASNPMTELGRDCQRLAERLERIHNLSSLHGEYKRARFAEILDDYAESVMRDRRRTEAQQKAAA